jgi:hypothetical protein
VRSVLSAVLISVVLSGCGGRQPANVTSVGQLRRGMTFEQAHRAAGTRREVIRRPQLIVRSGDPHSPFSRIWVYVKQSPHLITYVYLTARDASSRFSRPQDTPGALAGSRAARTAAIGQRVLRNAAQATRVRFTGGGSAGIDNAVSRRGWPCGLSGTSCFSEEGRQHE